MLIAVLGNFMSRNSSESAYVRELNRMGIETVQLQENMTTASQILLSCENADALMWVHTHGWAQEVNMLFVLDELKAKGIPTFAYHLDLWTGTSRESDIYDHPYFCCEYLFTVDGSLDTRMRNHHWVMPGIESSELEHPITPLKCPYDVVFVGSYDYHPEWPHRQEVVDFLRSIYGDRFTHIGKPGPTVRGKDLTAIYQGSKVVVGDSFCPRFSHPFYWSDRATETMGRGGFLIHPFVRGMDLFFRDRVHLRYYQYGDFEGLQKLVDHYLLDSSEEERDRIREDAFQEVASRHTYAHRLNQMLSVMAAKYPKLRK